MRFMVSSTMDEAIRHGLLLPGLKFTPGKSFNLPNTAGPGEGGRA
jgi:hypothetical protein